MSSLRVDGIEGLKKALEDAAKKEAIKEVVKSNGAALQQSMMRNAESQFTRGYSTGATKRSISLEIRDDGLTAAVSPGTDYSPYLEYGTRYMQAEPFVGPALNAQAPRFKSDLEKIMKG